MSNSWEERFQKASTFHGTEVISQVTPLTAEQATKAMAEGYKKVVGFKPTEKVLGLMVGQWALETGNGQSMRNFNFGNKKASGNEDFQYFRCSEVVNGVEQFYEPPHPACRFASYKSAAEGAAAFVRTLKSRKHWWDGLHTGTVEGFIKGLTTAPAYFTASPTIYANTLNNRMMSYEPYSKKYGSSVIGQVFLGLVVSGGLWWAWRDVKKQHSVLKSTYDEIYQVIK